MSKKPDPNISQVAQKFRKRFRAILIVTAISLALLIILVHYGILLSRDIAHNGTMQTIAEQRNTIDTLSSSLHKSEAKYRKSEESIVFLALLAQNFKNELETTKKLFQTQNSQTSELTQLVQRYEKLKSIDTELLKKYSRVFFLNEHYEPSRLSTIPTRCSYGGPHKFHSNALQHLVDLCRASVNAGNPVLVVSGYRSYHRQKSLKSSYRQAFGSLADTFSADQGFSEHQLGTAVDFTTREIGGPYDAFAKTEQYSWLLDNAHKYGFILSYPKLNIYYKYEPWHWRFVGVELATKLHNNKQNFNELDQRVLDEYLIKIFD